MTQFTGLSEREAALSREKYGSNAIPESEPTTFWAEFKATFQDPMIRILLAVALLMVVMCLFGYADVYEPAGTILAVILVAIVSAKTGVSSDTKYRQLKGSAKKDRCKVYRDGIITILDVDQVVVGDKVLLQAGDKIPADGVLIHGNVRVDNSALNGEAEECPKTAAPPGDSAARGHHRRRVRGRKLSVPWGGPLRRRGRAGRAAGGRVHHDGPHGPGDAGRRARLPPKGKAGPAGGHDL